VSIAKFVLDAGELAHVGETVRHDDITAQPISVALAYENPAIAPSTSASGMLEDATGCTVIIAASIFGT
jgi:hypothetical protein